MATEPHTLDAASFLNHIRTVLDASLQRWEFATDPSEAGQSHAVCVRFLGTGRVSRIIYGRVGWTADDDGKPNDRITGLLNGRKRDGDGNLAEQAPLPPRELNDDETIVDGDFYYFGGKKNPCTDSIGYVVAEARKLFGIRAFYRVEPAPLQVEAGKFYQRRDGRVVGPACQLEVRMQNDFHKWSAGHIYYGDCGRGMSDGSDWHGDLIREVPPPTKRDDAGVGK